MTGEIKMSSCCSKAVVVENVWLSQPGRGRKLLGTVNTCCRVGCPRPTVGAFQADPKAPQGIAAAWNLMLRSHPQPPYYFIIRDGSLVPESVVAAPLNPAPQERAAGLLTDEPEGEYEPA